jgi:hypothetical protein
MFSGRLVGKYSDDVPILDRAKNFKSKNLATDEGTEDNLPTVINSSNATLLDISNIVGVGLGASLYMVEDNLSLLRIGSVKMFLESCKVSKEENLPVPEILQPVDVDSVLQELLSLTNDELDEFNMASLNRFQKANINGGDDREIVNTIFAVKSLSGLCSGGEEKPLESINVKRLYIQYQGSG